MLKLLALLSLLLQLAHPITGMADSVDKLLAAQAAPEGVVFEIVSGDSDLLTTLLPVVKQDIVRLRKKFPKLPVAIVTHGDEQFALTKSNQARVPQLHDLARDLVNGQEVALHVCDTYAAMHGIEPEAFPDYVDVSAAGPAQVNDYRALGYEVIVLP